MNRARSQLRLDILTGGAWMLASMSWWIVGCGTSPETSKTAAPGGVAGPGAPLRAAAASDLQAALPRIAELFRSRTGIEVQPSFLSSGVLAQQIRQGAPFDVFLSANEAFVRDLAGEGIIRPESVHAYARGSLLLAVYRELGARIGSLGDLTRPEVKKIALANPETAPYGKAGKQALERAGLWEEVRPKIVIAESVRQALLYAQKGDAEAALVGRAIATVPEVHSVEIDPGLYDPIVQAMGIVADSSRRADAEKLAQFVLGEEGQAILKEFGFRPPADESPARGPAPPTKAEKRSNHE